MISTTTRTAHTHPLSHTIRAVTPETVDKLPLQSADVSKPLPEGGAEGGAEVPSQTSTPTEQKTPGAKGKPALPEGDAREKTILRSKRSFADTDQTLVLPGADSIRAPAQAQVKGDSALALRLSSILTQAANSPTPSLTAPVSLPKDATFTAWWEHFFSTFQSPDYLDWVGRIGLDMSTVVYSPKDGSLSGQVNGKHTLFQLGDDSGWTQVSTPIRAAGKIVAPGATALPVDASFKSNAAPAAVICDFYGPPLPSVITQNVVRERADELSKNNAFSALALNDLSRQPGDRSSQELKRYQEALSTHQVRYADQKRADNQLVVLFTLTILQNNPSLGWKQTTVENIPPKSSFGQWWRHFNNALQSPELSGWKSRNGIDPGTQMRLASDGTLLAKVNGVLTRFSPSDNTGWGDVSQQIVAAGKHVFHGFPHVDIPPSWSNDAAPSKYVAAFYGEDYSFKTEQAVRVRMLALRRNPTFSASAGPEHTWEALEVQQNALHTREQRYTQYVAMEAADKELTDAYRLALLEARGGEQRNSSVISGIPSESNFGQWWRHFYDTLQSPDYLEWANKTGIDTSTVTLFADGCLSAMVNGQRKTFTQHDNSGWAQLSEPIVNAAKAVAPQTDSLSTQPPFNASTAPFEVIADFYGEQHDITPDQAVARAAQLEATSAFVPLDANDPLRTPASRNHEVLEQRKQELLNQRERYAVQAAADSDLAVLYGEMLSYARGGQTPREAHIAQIPPDSLFGRWWQQLRTAFQSPIYVDWAQRNGIDMATVSFSPQDGTLSANVNGQLKTFTQAQNFEWAYVSQSIWAAAKVAAPKASTIHTDAAFSRGSVPFERVGEFYGETPELSPDAANRRAATLAVSKTFVDSDRDNPLRKPVDRTLTALQTQQLQTQGRNDTNATDSASEAELVARYASGLLTARAGTTPQSARIDIPAGSLFGQWWRLYNDALKNPDFLAWVNEQKLDTNAILRLYPSGGTLRAIVAGQIKTFTLDDDSGWAQVSGPLLHAARLLVPAYADDKILLANVKSETAPAESVATFYGEPFRVSPEAARQRAEALTAGKTFDLMTPSAARSRQALQAQRQTLVDRGNQQQVLDGLKQLLAEVETSPAVSIVASLELHHVRLRTGSSHSTHLSQPAERWVSTKQFLTDRGINVPQSQAQLRNLIQVMSNPLPVPAVNDTLAALDSHQRTTLRLLRESADKNPEKVAGYELRQFANWGATPATIVQGLTDHLRTAHNVDASFAAVAARLLLATAAPEFLVKGLPFDIVYGSREWTVLSAAVNRIEKMQPGASAVMTFNAIMAFADTDAVTPTDSIEQEKAQDRALTHWALVRGLLQHRRDGIYYPEEIQAAKDSYREGGGDIGNTQGQRASQPLNDWKFWRKTATQTEQQRAAQRAQERAVREGQERLFEVKMEMAKNDDRVAYNRGFETGPSTVQGYASDLTVNQIVDQVVAGNPTPEEVGRAVKRIEYLQTGWVTEGVVKYRDMMKGAGAEVMPHTQSHYLSRADLFSQGNCAGLSYVMAFAALDNKQKAFVENLHFAAANPEHPEARLMIKQILDLHQVVKRGSPYHNPMGGATVVEQRSYTVIAPRLEAATQTTSFMLEIEGHAMTAGVNISPTGDRSYYFYDPNFGYATFTSSADMAKGMKVFFTVLKPPSYRFFGENRADPEVKLSEFSGILPAAHRIDRKRIEAMYSVALKDLDTGKLIDTADVPTGAALTHDSNLAKNGGRQFDDFNNILSRLSKLHSTQGVQQYDYGLQTLLSIKHYRADYANSIHDAEMNTLYSKLSAAVSAALPPPGGYAHIFEWMEKARLAQSVDKIGGMGGLKFLPSTTIDGVEVTLKELYSQPRPDRQKKVADALNSALATLVTAQPALAKHISKLEVIISPANTESRSKLYLGSPPTLVIGEDFFDAKMASKGQQSVADRVAEQRAKKGNDFTQAKQEALLVNQLAAVLNYESNTVAYLNAAHSPPSIDAAASAKLSDMASNSAKDFMAESLTALIYDGKLDPTVTAALSKLAVTHVVPFEGPLDNAIDTGHTPHRPQPAPFTSSEVQRLQALDATLPALRIGTAEITRVEAYQMGLRINGKAIEAALLNDPDGKKLINAAQLNVVEYSSRIKAVQGQAKERLIAAYVELGTHRDPTGPALIYLPADASLEVIQLNSLLEPLIKKLPADFKRLQAPSTFSKTGASGAAMQMFGTYQSIRSVFDNFKNGNTTDALFDTGALTTDYGSMAAEVALNKLSTKMAEKAGQSAAAFTATSIGKGLKVGGAGVGLASVVFDVRSAVNSFNAAAAATEPKVKQDHYVAGALSIASTLSSIALTVAMYKGSPLAGAVGIGVAAALMLGQAIYTAARAVDDIDDVIDLTPGQRLNAGWNSFWGVPIDYAIMKPYFDKLHKDRYIESSRVELTKLLNGDLKKTYQTAYFGNVDVVVSPPVRESTSFFDDLSAVLIGPTRAVNSFTPSKPSVVTALNDSDDSLTLTDEAVSLVPVSRNGNEFNRVDGTAGPGKGLIWSLGGGNDSVEGVKSRPNLFLLGGGKKTIKGGDKDDVFMMSPNDLMTRFISQYKRVLEEGGVHSVLNAPRFMPDLDAGNGSNTLIMTEVDPGAIRGISDLREERLELTIDLAESLISVGIRQPARHPYQRSGNIKSFSNVATMKGGQSRVIGSDRDNQITLNGQNDYVTTGRGKNTIVINGGGVVRGAYTAVIDTAQNWTGGNNTYAVMKGSADVIIYDANKSLVTLDYTDAEIVLTSTNASGDVTLVLSETADNNRRTVVFKAALKVPLSESAAEGSNIALPMFLTKDGKVITFRGVPNNYHWSLGPTLQVVREDMLAPLINTPVA
ncbi:hypothetical protein SAMN04490179_4407 [Pseudomonas antarctica]|uniref:Uncharacterized protein n=1 Tax=Pseudomonas antarctica TaxID=219572 RepID=A0A1H0BPN3_9PSED|nr:hypothetical protein [Pseudomonas antarctica]KAF2406571.1 hypothetical protein PSAN_47470 [Pseudomonas antarctica]SDN47493.1 hypothetical protein SAMN04490179_4407 [Pseudomonas antarctica]